MHFYMLPGCAKIFLCPCYLSIYLSGIEYVFMDPSIMSLTSYLDSLLVKAMMQLFSRTSSTRAKVLSILLIKSHMHEGKKKNP